MGQQHNELRRGQLSAALTRAVGDTRGGGLERFSETLQPTIDLWSLPEWRLLREETAFARRCDAPAVALRAASIELTLLTTTSTIAVIERVVPLLGDIDLVIDSGDPIGANPTTRRGLPLDDRYPVAGEVSQLLITQGDLATGANLPQWTTAPASVAVPTPHWILVPGSKLFIVAVDLATAIRVNIWWRERAAFPGELVGGP